MGRHSREKPTFVQHLSQFEGKLRDQSFSEVTIASYLDRIFRFSTYCRMLNLKSDISPEELQPIAIAYGDYLYGSLGYSGNSINAILTAIERFISLSYQCKIKFKRYAVATKDFRLTADESRRLLCAIDSCRSPKFKALAMLLTGAGLRVREARALMMSDVEINSRGAIIRINQGQRRAVDVGLEVKEALEQWFLERPAYLRGEKSEVVFPNKTGRQMANSSIDAIVRTIARQAGLNVSASTLRNIFLSNLVATEPDLLRASEIAGYSRVDSLVLVRRRLDDNITD